MKKIITIACLVGVSSILHAESNTVSKTENEIIGEWKAGESFMPQPPKEIQQDIKSITFQTNSVVHWKVVENGKIETRSGTYSVLQNKESLRHLPTIMIELKNTESYQTDDKLVYSEVTVDIDSRFNRDIVESVLKMKSKDGKILVFVKQKIIANQGMEPTSTNAQSVVPDD